MNLKRFYMGFVKPQFYLFLQGVPVPEFQLAYGAELNGCVDPTLDQMRVLVSKRKARPLFPQVWKNSNPAVQRLREIMEDAWDTDGEARTTATCVQERSRELAPLWDHYHHKQVSGLHFLDQ